MNTLSASAPEALAPTVTVATPRTGLIVVDEGRRDAPPSDTRWCAALPAAKRVLELALGDDALARAYKQRQPDSHWTAVDLSGRQHASLSPQGIDAWADGGAGGCDLVVLTDALPWLAEPAATLEWLAAQASPGARLLLRVAQHASLAQLERLLDGDLGVEARLAGSPGQPRLLSHAVIFRQLMDAGWMPHLLDAHCEAQSRRDPATQAVLESLVTASGLSNPIAQHSLRFDRLVIEARRCFEPGAEAAPADAAAGRFDVLVPTNDERQLRLNIEASPGLRECGARIVSVRGATSAASAFERGLPHIGADWVLLCHQDVYFPSRFGHHLAALLAAIPPEERRQTLIGFVGLAAGARGHGAEPAGFVIDRLHRADHAASAQAISIDELAIVVARDSLHRIDARLGWHLWATDLCLTAIVQHGVFPRIVRAPLFHNSRTGWSLPAAFVESARTLAAKWSGMGALHTLCGTIDEHFFARHGGPQA